MLEYEQYKLELAGLEDRILDLEVSLDIKGKLAKIEDLEAQATAQDFWDDMENSQKVLQLTKQLKDKVDLYSKDIKMKESYINIKKAELIKINSAKENLEANIKKVKDALYNIDLTLQKLEEEILYNINRKEEISKHITVVTQMNTLIKRDFRGFLLINIIDYINIKAKEYALDVFGNDSLEFSLDGNNINISYNGKAFENLSGGEKQRIDLIIQFAIRNMMQQYLNFSSNILILDEIFDQLDTNGCSNILNLISSKLTDIESIFIISHRAGELEIPYDSELIVTKSTSGISTVKWQ